ncbi:unnamed protein product [Callosobruchus maculatus]|uniref:Uncharacterized protein n=1 Tax=Callosobruchus maculatus TaxID=64391 RepID=A0A653CEM6_CALMS|nr:unnamed protein product [Callosobruchus maculatus]
MFAADCLERAARLIRSECFVASVCPPLYLQRIAWKGRMPDFRHMFMYKYVVIYKYVKTFASVYNQS